MNPKLNKTIIVFHISGVLYLVLGVALLTILRKYVDIAPLIALVSLGMWIFIEIVIHGLKTNKFWAWVASIIICGLYIPTFFIVFGIIGLYGLLDKEVRNDFL